MNNNVEICIIGGVRALGVYHNVLNKYSNVRYFRDERAYTESLFQSPGILIIQESNESSDFLDQISNNDQIHVIYLSPNKSFKHVFTAFKKGISDYVWQDAYLCFTAKRSVGRIIRASQHGNKRFIDSCELMKGHALRYRLARWIYGQ